jgi:hypothetical protein
MVDTPLAQLRLDQVRPPRRVLDEIMAGMQTGKGQPASGGGG